MSLSDLTPARWHQISAVLDLVLEAAPGSENEVLDAACREDDELRSAVQELLGHRRAAETFLDRPVVEMSPLLDPAVLAGEESGQLPEVFGERIGPYRVSGRIGRGGMGEVVLAERADGQFEQRVALKLVKPGLDTTEILDRFLRERQILARLEHPHIAHLLDGGRTSDGRPYFAMEYVDGEPITTYCDRRCVGIEERLGLVQQVCDALQHAHRNLVVHRDLKPSNVLVSSEGELKLLDFGIAKLLDAGEEEGRTSTRADLQLMTPAYAAPEQVLGEPVTTATDVWALGVLLYELLAGVRPFGGQPNELRRAIVDANPRRPSRAVLENGPGSSSASERARARATSPQALSRRLRGDLDAIVGKALRREPQRRYSSVEALRQDLESHMRHLPVAARPESLTYRVGKFASRNRVGVLTAGLVLLSLAGGLVTTAWQARARALEARKAEEVKNFVLDVFALSDPSEARGREVTARELLEAAALRIDLELSDEPEVKAELLSVLANLHEKLGMSTRALELVEQALELDHTLRVPEHKLADDLLLEGTSLTTLGRLDEAESALRRALHDHERDPGEESPQVAEDLDRLAEVRRLGGDYDEAEALARRSLAIRRTALGEDDPAYADSLNNLGLMLRLRGRYAEAADLYRQALELRRRTLGEDHPNVAESLGNLAVVLAQTGQREEAEAAARRSLQIYEQVYGEDHPRTALGRNNLAALLQTWGSYKDAEVLHRQVLDYWQRHEGNDHPNAVTSMHNLAATLRQMGRYEEAERLFRELLVRWTELLGPEHPNLAVTLDHLAALRCTLGDLDEAEELEQRALELRKKVLGQRHPEVAASLSQLGWIAAARGDLDRAESLFHQALELAHDTVDPEHPVVLRSRVGLAHVDRRRGRLAEAQKELEAVVSALSARVGADQPELIRANLELGLVLDQSGRHDEAEPILRDVVARRRRLMVDGNVLTAEAELALAQCLEGGAKDEEAAQLIHHAAPILERVLGARSREAGDAHALLAELSERAGE